MKAKFAFNLDNLEHLPLDIRYPDRITNLQHIEGGFAAWEEAGFDVERSQ